MADADDMPRLDRHVAALRGLVARVSRIHPSDPLLGQVAVLREADQGRVLHPAIWAPLDCLALHHAEDNLDSWLRQWAMWAVSVENLGAAGSGT